MFIDAWLRSLAFASIGLFLASTLILLTAPNRGTIVVFGTVSMWGLAFGGLRHFSRLHPCGSEACPCDKVCLG